MTGRVVARRLVLDSCPLARAEGESEAEVVDEAQRAARIDVGRAVGAQLALEGRQPRGFTDAPGDLEQAARVADGPAIRTRLDELDLRPVDCAEDDAAVTIAIGSGQTPVRCIAARLVEMFDGEGDLLDPGESEVPSQRNTPKFGVCRTASVSKARRASSFGPLAVSRSRSVRRTGMTSPGPS
jgi:hypothetical protein